MYCYMCKLHTHGKFCTFCGIESVNDEFKCRKCKAVVYVRNKFCPECGIPMQAEAKDFVDEQLRNRENHKGGE